jgi:hypothetical protein
MAGMRMSMRKIREVLRLTHELGLSVRQVREASGVGKTAVSEYVSPARETLGTASRGAGGDRAPYPLLEAPERELFRPRSQSHRTFLNFRSVTTQYPRSGTWFLHGQRREHS